MKHPDHLAFTLLLSLCTLGFLPAAAQDPDGKPSNPQDTTELRLNTDAVKLIQFDFTPDLSKMNQPKEAPLDKKWMEFKADLSLPRSLIDTTRVRKPTGYIRLAPYSIWTKYGEEPVYDRTVEGRPKEQKIYWTFNPYRSYYNDDWSPTPSTGSMYQMNTSPVGPAICINNLDFIMTLYETFNKHGRTLRHNRKYANAWKTYKDYKPTREDSLKFPNYLRRNSLAFMPLVTDSVADSLSTVQSSPLPADTLSATLPDHQANHRGIVIPERPAPAPRPEKKKEEEPKNMDELYDYIREKKAQDSLFYQEMFHSEKTAHPQGRCGENPPVPEGARTLRRSITGPARKKRFGVQDETSKCFQLHAEAFFKKPERLYALYFICGRQSRPPGSDRQRLPGDSSATPS